jgi:hypothetical protein
MDVLVDGAVWVLTLTNSYTYWPKRVFYGFVKHNYIWTAFMDSSISWFIIIIFIFIIINFGNPEGRRLLLRPRCRWK